jgi:hypothetical protein
MDLVTVGIVPIVRSCTRLSTNMIEVNGSSMCTQPQKHLKMMRPVDEEKWAWRVTAT